MTDNQTPDILFLNINKIFWERLQEETFNRQFQNLMNNIRENCETSRLHISIITDENEDFFNSIKTSLSNQFPEVNYNEHFVTRNCNQDGNIKASIFLGIHTCVRMDNFSQDRFKMQYIERWGFTSPWQLHLSIEGVPVIEQISITNNYDGYKELSLKAPQKRLVIA